MKTRMCKVKECLCIAHWNPSYVVCSPDSSNKFRMDSNLDICDVHKEKFTLVDLLPDDMFKQIQKMFSSTFIMPPKRENITLEWLPIVADSIPVFNAAGRKVMDVPVINRPEIPK